MENLHIEDLIAIQKLYAACVAIHEYARTVGAPLPLRDLYNNRKHHTLPKYAIDFRLECLMFDVSRHPECSVDVIEALKDIAGDLASYIR